MTLGHQLAQRTLELQLARLVRPGRTVAQREFASERGVSFFNLRNWIYRLPKESRPLVPEPARCLVKPLSVALPSPIVQRHRVRQGRGERWVLNEASAQLGSRP